MPVEGDPHGINAVLAQLPVSAQQVAFGVDPRQNESAGDRVANVMHGIGAALLNIMPGYAQAHAQRTQASARQQAEMQMMMVRGAMEQAGKGNTEFFEHLPKEVEKAAKTTLGPVADVAFGYFRHVANAVQEHRASWGRHLAEGQARGDSLPTIIATAHAAGIDVPQQAESEGIRYTYGPQIAERQARATIGPAVEKQGALLPGEVAKAGAVTETQEQTREPYRIATEGRSESRATRREARTAQRQQAAEERRATAAEEKEARAEARKVLGANAVKWRNPKDEQPPANLTVEEAVAQGYYPIDPAEGRGINRLMSIIGLSKERKVGEGTHIAPAAPKAPSPAQSVIDKWSTPAGQ